MEAGIFTVYFLGSFLFYLFLWQIHFTDSYIFILFIDFFFESAEVVYLLIMGLGISLLAAVSGCKTDDDGTQLLMTSLGPARSAQSGLHSEQVGFYWYLN